MKRILTVVMLLSMTTMLWAQNQSISGKVVGSDGTGLPGVTVLVKGTSNGSVTDIDGNYRLSGPGDATLVFSYVGFESQEVAVNNRSVVDVTLSEDVTALDEVVVTALGVEREKKALAYSVTEVGGDRMTMARETNMMNALVGKVAGVNVSKTATGPAGSTRVVIRGNTSLTGNNQPLYVVDGVPIDNQNLGAAGTWGGSDRGDGISSLNPDDIESMSVLKGSSAAALYGARASNGVILVTTKSGSKRQGVGVEINSNFIAENAISFLDYQSEYGSGLNGVKPTTQAEAAEHGKQSWGAPLDGSSVVQFDGVSRPYSYQGDAIDAFYETGYTWTNSISLTGGGELANFRFSAADMKNQSVMPGSGMDRNNFGTNLNLKLGKFSAAASGTYIIQDVQNTPNVSDIVWNANNTIRTLPTSVNVEDLKGDPDKLGADPVTGFEYLPSSSVWWQNPYWSAYQAQKTDLKDRFMGNMRLRFDITDWLYVQGRAGIDSWSVSQTFLSPTGHSFQPGGSMNLTEIEFKESNIDFIVGANKQFDSGLGLNVLAGGNQMHRVDDRKYLNGSNFAIPFFHSYGNLTAQSSGVGFSEEKINSLFYQAEFSWNNMIYLTNTGRQDWFSTLNGRSIFYPSVGVSAVLSDMIDIPAFDFLKVRGSWGEVSGATSPYQLNLSYALRNPHGGFAQGIIAQGSVPNSNLVPLTAGEIEFGIDMRFFGGKLGVDFAYYDRKTENDILNASIIASSGYSGTVVNVGEITNKGVEFLVYGNPVSAGNFKWDVSFNMAYNNSEVVSLLDDEVDDEFLQVGMSRSLTGFIQHIEGLPYSQIVGYKFLRDASGNIVHDDEGLPMRDDEAGQVAFGSGVAPLTGGFSNDFQYGNFVANFLIDFKFGGYIHSGTNSEAYKAGLHKETLEGRESGIGAVEPDQLHLYYRRIADQITEPFVYKSDFIKFRELSVGYSFPSSVMSKTPLAGATISVVGRNLFRIYAATDNIDPESTYNNGNAQGLEFMSMPQTRGFGFNVNLKF